MLIVRLLRTQLKSFRRVAIARQSAFEDHRFELMRAFRAGATIELAAEQAGIATNTLRRWLSNGRNHPEGPYGDFASRVDRIRSGDADATGLARDFIEAVHGAFRSDDNGPALAKVHARIHDLGPVERGRVELELAQHVMFALLKVFPPALCKTESAYESCRQAFYEYVDEVYAAMDKRDREREAA